MHTSHHKSVKAWLRQANEDLDTAEYLVDGERYSYGVYLMHLALEKALKGLYLHRFETAPPVTHDLLYLADRTNLVIPDELRPFLNKINKASVLNFYRDHLFHEQVTYDADTAETSLKKARNVFDWITDHVE